MEKSRSWPSAHDWKSCIPQKGIEGSNPSFSAIKKTIAKAIVFFTSKFLVTRGGEIMAAILTKAGCFVAIIILG